MLIAVISDIHDHLENLARALDRITTHRDDAGEAVGALLCCGDLNSPFVVGALAQGFAGPVTVVFGNNEGDKYRITSLAAGLGGAAAGATPAVGEPTNVRIAGETARLELGGRRVCLHHFNEVGAIIAATDRFDLVCYGHDHAYLLRRGVLGATEMNPGAIMGWRPGHGAVPVTYGLYDTTTGVAAIHDIERAGPLLTLTP